MTHDARMIVKMLEALAASKQTLRALQGEIMDTGINFEIDKLYDGFTTAAEQLGVLFVEAESKE